MSDNHDEPGATGSETGALPEGDFPLDFLAEASDLGPEEHPSHSLEPVAPLVPTRSPADFVTREPAFPDALAEPAPPLKPDIPHHPIFPFIMAFGFLSAIAIAWALNLTDKPSAVAGTATTAATATAPPAEPPARESAVALSGTVEALKEEVAGVTKQVKDLQGKIETLSKPEPAPDLAPLHTKVAALAKSAEAVGPLPDKVSALDEKVGGVDQSLKELNEKLATVSAQVAALQGDLKKVGDQVASGGKPAPKPATTPTPSPATTTEPVDVNVEGQAMSQAVELFKAGKYKEAFTVFKTVEDNDPKDARVWYYAALSQGLATADWKGDALKLVKKGVEREKAGTPKTSEIDAAFAKVPDSVRPWLDYYRKSAK